jgi:acetyltransferase-like isoleucine patch superfamily enzyme
MGRPLPDDWYDGEVPDNARLDEGSYVESSYAFSRFESRREPGFVMRHGSAAYGGTVFDVGPEGRVEVGRYALLNSVHIICDVAVEIGDHALLSWNVVLMDAYRRPGGRLAPIRIGPNVWIGFDSCVLPGVTIGAGSIVGARSVVIESVPPYVIVAGNPARVIRALDSSEVAHAEGVA